MAERRKLQAEIDRTLKKISEGVDIFDEIWQKVQDATNVNQKEKFETDLKKEIKKLQRYRDSIKTWLSSADIKDKSALIENRKLIEQKMEQFKVVEREMKTKAFSKTGLTVEQKLDPKEREREEIMMWLQDNIDKLTMQCDHFESEVETLQAGGKRKKEKDKQEKIDSMKHHLERHKYHIQRLEMVMRLMDNNSIDVEKIKDIKDDVNYYVENSSELDFEENEFIYDDLELDVTELTQQLGGVTAIGSLDEQHVGPDGLPTSETTGSSSPSPSPGATGKQKEDSLEKDASPVEATARSTPATPLTSHTSSDRALSTPPPSTQIIHQPTPLVPFNAAAQQTKSLPASASKAMTGYSYRMAASSGQPAQLPQQAPTPLVGLQQQHQQPSDPSDLSIFSSNQPQLPASVMSAVSERDRPQSLLRTKTPELMREPQRSSPEPPPAISQTHTTPTPAVSMAESIATLKRMAADALTQQAGQAMVSSASNVDSLLQQQANVAAALLQQTSGSGLSTTQGGDQSEKPLKVPPYLGASPLGTVTPHPPMVKALKQLEAASQHVPLQSDSERVRHYLPRTPVQTPVHYPQQVLPGSDTVDFCTRLSQETLFFMFYYMEGTRAQLLAAQALKKLSWRFHSKYMMWFQRHEEPIGMTEQYEKGTYLYFDFEKWAQRKKEGFTFEYKYLEDKDLSVFLDPASSQQPASAVTS